MGLPFRGKTMTYFKALARALAWIALACARFSSLGKIRGGSGDDDADYAMPDGRPVL
jgi:hypothetical protein